MSQRNDDANGAAMGLAVVGCAAFFLAAFAFAVLAFFALVLTVLSIIAWNNELKMGSHIITPTEARCFIKRGVLGSLILTAFVAFCSALFGLKVPPEWAGYIVIAGYSLGSVGMMILEVQEAERNVTIPGQVVAPPPAPTFIAPPAAQAPPPPFRYASWDDEGDEP